jgi:hypothetical protein
VKSLSFDDGDKVKVEAPDFFNPPEPVTLLVNVCALEAFAYSNVPDVPIVMSPPYDAPEPSVPVTFNVPPESPTVVAPV